MILQQLQNANFLYINKNWTIKRQILIASLLIWTFIFLMLLLIILQTQAYIQNTLQETSSQIFISQTSEQLNNIWIQQNSMARMFQYTKHQVISTQAIYKYLNAIIQQSKVHIFQWPQLCLNNQSEVDSYCFSSSTTCGIFGKQPNQQQKVELETVAATANILTQFRIAFDHTNQAPIYFFKDNSAQFYCITTGIPFPNTFIPNKRPYYSEFQDLVNAHKDLLQTYFASPYKVVSGKIKIPLMSGLMDSNDELIGMVAKDIDFGYASVASSTISNFTIYVIDENGKIFYSKLYNQINLTVSFFNDTNFTGFNQSDFQQIINQYNHLPFENNCQNFLFQDILCRYNQKFEENFIIKSQLIPDSPLILVLLIDTNSIYKENQDHITIYQYYFQKAIKQSIILVIIIPLCFILIASIFMNLMLRQFNSLIKMIQGKLFPNKKQCYFYEIYKSKNFFDSEAVSHLIIAITQLFEHHFTNEKSPQCLQQEKSKYPNHLYHKKRYYENLVKQMWIMSDQISNEIEKILNGLTIVQCCLKFC